MEYSSDEEIEAWLNMPPVKDEMSVLFGLMQFIRSMASEIKRRREEEKYLDHSDDYTD